ncbi:DUF4350 domain-containing protein [Actinomycetospora sp. TBRC 11914]|uniref:DUF4350 domain-containing protein n=1 Tax=Actinomycetospora sp. TBRC 11914 TaxID=2729387 RepID=UPI00145F2D77|nr:DUF4350 domain-containing protein [Actinomycetospora sp. TBRC 11914]NMO92782.1 DUF4350 domain-containing protein [Actinomycetospora sp. TBRC 11914]
MRAALATRLRRARAPLAVAALVLAAAVVLTVLGTRADRGLLDPDSADPAGSAALAALLRGQGVTVTPADRPEALGTLDAASTVLVTVPDRLRRADLATLARSGARVVLVAPGPAALEALAPGVRPGEAPPGLLDTETPPPACGIPAALAAGPVDLDGAVYTTTPPAVGCYPRGTTTGLAVSGRTTVVGAATPFTNEALDRAGNAALTLQLLGATPRLLWYVPPVLPDAGGTTPLVRLVPPGWLWGAVTLLLAGVVTAWWRGRRLGPPVAERLPVRVPAAETTRGRAGLYRRLGARGRAADVLRDDARRRLAARLGLGPGGSGDALVAAVAGAAPGYDPAAVADLLHGAAPVDDAALVALADALDALRAAVGTTSGRVPAGGEGDPG